MSDIKLPDINEQDALLLAHTRLSDLAGQIDPGDCLPWQEWHLIKLGFFLGLGCDLLTAHRLADHLELA